MVKKKPVVTKKSSAVKKTKSAKRSPIVNKTKSSASKKSVLKKKTPAKQTKAVSKPLKSTRAATKKPIKKTAAVKKIVAKKKPVVKKAAPKKSIAKKPAAQIKSKKAAPAKIKAKPVAKAKAAAKKSVVIKKKPVTKSKKIAPTKKLSRPIKKAPVKKAVIKKPIAAKKPALKKLPQKKTPIKTKPVAENKIATQKLQPINKPVVIKKDQKKLIPQVTNKKMIATNKSTHLTSTSAINAEYMTPAHLGHFQQLLKKWKEDLMARVDKTIHHMQDEAANFADPNDRATQEEEFSLELRTRDRERKLMMKIDEAIERIEAGDYGFCTECGIGIGLERLEARPTATLCIDCKTLDEIREKQMAD